MNVWTLGCLFHATIAEKIRDDVVKGLRADGRGESLCIDAHSTEYSRTRSLILSDRRSSSLLRLSVTSNIALFRAYPLLHASISHFC